MGAIRSFGHIRAFEYFEKLKVALKQEIELKPKEYILGVDEQEYKKYLFDKFELELLSVDLNSESFDEPAKSKIILTDEFRGDKYEKDAYTFHIKYPFAGSPVLFQISPSSKTITGADIIVSESTNTVSFKLVSYNLDANTFLSEKEQMRQRAFTNVGNANKDAQQWNNELPGIINQFFSETKGKYNSENSFFTAINLKVDSNKKNVFAAPTIQKKVIVQPTISKTKEFSIDPAMAKEMYNDVIEAIYASGKTMEKKPSLYEGKDEEGIRDQFLFVLESRYNNATSNGEAFNKGGKTDIMLKHAADGSNLFIAECKIWKGASEFHKAISQLFDNYLTWRDSKVAVMFFVKNNDFSAVLNTIKSEAKKHINFVKEDGSHGESSFSYIFNLPQDKDKEVFLEIIAFHYFE